MPSIKFCGRFRVALARIAIWSRGPSGAPGVHMIPLEGFGMGGVVLGYCDVEAGGDEVGGA